MEDIFISYSKSDVKAATVIARKLTDFGFSVWWDNLLSPGELFDEVLTNKVKGSKVVLVLWTEDSIQSKWVHAEASLALSLDKLIPIKPHTLDFKKLPLPFNTLHTINITNFQGLIQYVSKKLELDDQKRQEIDNKLKRKILIRYGLIATPLFLSVALILGYVFFPPLQHSITMAMSAVKESLYPCKGINVHIGNALDARRECLPAKNFEDFTFQDCNSCPQIVVIPQGSFLIGSPETEVGRDLDEGPQISISLKEFAIGKSEITKAQWSACVNAGMCRPRPQHAQVMGDSHPISFISWNDTQDYVHWLSKATEKSYRLPTEAEWEYAARAGTDVPRNWGFSASEACKYGNVGDVSYGRIKNEIELSIREKLLNHIELGGQHKCDDKYSRLAPVRSFRPNQYQLFDTIGNVWEWVEDCAFPNYEAIPKDGRAYRERDCKVSTLRGGSYVSGPASARSANRFQGGKSKDQFQSDYGFRIVRDLP